MASTTSPNNGQDQTLSEKLDQQHLTNSSQEQFQNTRAEASDEIKAAEIPKATGWIIPRSAFEKIIPGLEFQQDNQSKSAKTKASDKIEETEIEAARIGAKATRCAAYIGALATIFAGWVVFSVTQHYQNNDGRQKALNDYVTNVRELLAHKDFDGNSPQVVAALQKSRTFLIMRELGEDGDRKGQILRFLHETCLIRTEGADAQCIQPLMREEFQLSAEELQQAWKNLRMAKVALSGINLDEVDLEDAAVPNMDLKGAYMRGANLQNAALSGSDLTAANLAARPGENFKDVWLDVITSFSLDRLSPKPSNWQKAKLIWAVFDRADLTGVNLSEAQLGHASFVYAKLMRANLSETDLRFANFRGADLSDAILSGANLANAIYDANTKFESITAQQKATMILIAPEAQLDGKDLSNQDLSRADLSRASLSSANLYRADLRFANLTNANLTGTNLSGACYVEGTEATSFPPGFEPEKYNMVSIPADRSNLDSSEFQPCRTP